MFVFFKCMNFVLDIWGHFLQFKGKHNTVARPLFCCFNARQEKKMYFFLLKKMYEIVL